MSYMSKTLLTVRTDERLREALSERAAALGKTVSQLVRDILETAVADRPLENRVGHLKGRLRLKPEADDPWRARLRAHNWRP